ncbi:uncharacterized protein SCHCODRAFT_02602621 [Schizophyllum commune H4-8]|uniref:Uncharacterized protein n=1 Tax=Schizophyllum commune (strain H4-8 / FGSC 9210) TaxID=578458 RepID=D8QGS1_SCHCM|nr:uncharacterized protein SCHCODRAFT_02602621 [Schizophyllum commune H4-8]KAI5886861.1 hypothetical protein SCHCODRAFT_02602621 [Schizophyllum commune H4-8]
MRHAGTSYMVVGSKTRTAVARFETGREGRAGEPPRSRPANRGGSKADLSLASRPHHPHQHKSPTTLDTRTYHIYDTIEDPPYRIHFPPAMRSEQRRATLGSASPRQRQGFRKKNKPGTRQVVHVPVMRTIADQLEDTRAPPAAHARPLSGIAFLRDPSQSLPPLDCKSRAPTCQNTEARRLSNCTNPDAREADSSAALRFRPQAQIQHFTPSRLQYSRPRVNGNDSRSAEDAPLGLRRRRAGGKEYPGGRVAESLSKVVGHQGGDAVMLCESVRLVDSYKERACALNSWYFKLGLVSLGPLADSSTRRPDATGSRFTLIITNVLFQRRDGPSSPVRWHNHMTLCVAARRPGPGDSRAERRHPSRSGGAIDYSLDDRYLHPAARRYPEPSRDLIRFSGSLSRFSGSLRVACYSAPTYPRLDDSEHVRGGGDYAGTRRSSWASKRAVRMCDRHLRLSHWDSSNTAASNFIELDSNRDQAHLSVGMTLKQGLTETCPRPGVALVSRRKAFQGRVGLMG